MGKIQLIDAETLYYKPLEHPKMLIDGVLSDGLAIMAGDSKIGKSWMVLWMCLQISKGEPIWGIPTKKSDVVYLALEDREWRVQQRMQDLTDTPPDNLHFGFSCGQLGAELESQIEDVLKDYSLLIQMTAFYGLRRSEALGLRWDAIDFERNTITIRHIVTNAKVDGKCVLVCADRAKTKSSLRSLPLVPNIREKLLALQEQQKENKRICGNCYSKKYDGYVFVDAMGNIFNPRSVTENFNKLLERNNLRHIRFHDLRHSCASLLLANDVPMKQIQEWLGHSDISTTANIYSHLDYKSKIVSANVMDHILTLPDTGSYGWSTQ